MTDKPLPHIDDDDHDDDVEICPDCGSPMHKMSADDIFTARIQTIQELLEDADPVDVMLTLGIVAGEYIGDFTTAKVRGEMRAMLLEVTNDHIKATLGSIKQYKREAAAVRRAGGRMETMPHVPTTRQ